MHSGEVHGAELFDPDIYRRFSQDLEHFSDEECRAHFEEHGARERRVFGPTATMREQMSMRWLRGRGLEIGAGSRPLPLFGAADIAYADRSADDAIFGGPDRDHVFHLDDANVFERVTPGALDFVVALHVLEHVDSVLRAIANLVRMVRPGGIVYVAVPHVEFGQNQPWMQFSFAHHVEEYDQPLKHLRLHEQMDPRYPELLKSVDRDTLRYALHKHVYTYQGWTELVLQALSFLGRPAELVDSAFGKDNVDCHFVLRRVPG